MMLIFYACEKVFNTRPTVKKNRRTGGTQPDFRVSHPSDGFFAVRRVLKRLND